MGVEVTRDKYSERLEVLLRASGVVRAGVAAAGIATIGLVAWIPVDDALKAAGLAWAGYATLKALRAARREHRFLLDEEGNVVVDGEPGRMRAGSFVAPWLAIARWRPVGARLDRTLLIAPDMLAPDVFRRVRVLLRFGRLDPPRRCGVLARVGEPAGPSGPIARPEGPGG